MEAHLIDAEAALGGEDFYDEVRRCIAGLDSLLPYMDVHVCMCTCMFSHTNKPTNQPTNKRTNKHQEMRLVLAGFQRPERRFPSFPDLVAAIHQVGPDNPQCQGGRGQRADSSPQMRSVHTQFLLNQIEPYTHTHTQ